MIDSNKIVLFCTVCNRRFVGDMNTNVHKCPLCSHSDVSRPILVVDGNLIVKK